MNMRACCYAMVFFGLFGGLAQAAPANDNFANAINLGSTSTASLTANNTGATLEIGEQSSFYDPTYGYLSTGGSSVWWNWTAPTSGHYYINLNGSSLYPIVAVFTGSPVSALTLITFSVGSGAYGTTPLSFQTTAGTTYRIAVHGYYGGQGAITLNLYPGPVNDDFATATDLGSAASASVTGSTTNGSFEFNEPDYSNPMTGVPNSYGGSIWWKWTAPASNTLEVVDTAGSSFDTILDVYTGISMSSLTSVRHCDDTADDHHSRVAFPVTAGTTYYIRVVGRNAATGAVKLNLQNYSAPVTAADHLLWGRAYLESPSDSLGLADAEFSQVLAMTSGDATARVLKSFVQVARLQQLPAYTQLLTNIGATKSGTNLYKPRLSIPKDANGVPLLVPGSSTALIFQYLQQQVVPALNTAESHLSTVTDSAFLMSMSDAETGKGYSKIDYGAVQVLRSIIQAIKAASNFSEVYDMSASLQTLVDQARNKTLKSQTFKNTFSNFWKFSQSNKRAVLSNSLILADQYYQDGSSFIRTQRINPSDKAYLFHFTATSSGELHMRQNTASMSASLKGVTLWGSERVDLSKLATVGTPLRDFLGNFHDNSMIANTTPDPTFGGTLPDGTQLKVNNFFLKHNMLYDISTYSNWASRLLPGAAPADALPGGNPARDGLNNNLKFAFGLDPNVPEVSASYAVTDIVKDPLDNKNYLTIAFVRRIDSSAVTYVVEVSDDLVTWDKTQLQVQQVGRAVPNADGFTETAVFRVKVDTSQFTTKFMRIEATVVP